MENTQSIPNSQAAHHSILTQELINFILSKITLFSRRYRTRKGLAALSPEQLLDIDISREQALKESQKPFWK